MSETPPDDDASKEWFPLPRWALWVVLPGVLGPVLIFGFIVWSESAHDVATCPYQEHERREIAPGVVVVDDARRCLQGVEEHRYTLVRDAQPRLLGRRRFAPEAFTPARYRWRAEVTPEGEVELLVENDGQDPVVFREGTAEEHAAGNSR
jgi:hypothetical protein